MARGRFVSKAISLDEKVDALSDDTCRLLFTWLITHLDCEGRMHGDAQTVKSIVFPRRRDISVKKIEKYLKELENSGKEFGNSGLILRYFVDGNQYLCMKNFEKHQVGLRKNQEAQSQIPPFTTELKRGRNGIRSSEVKVKVKVKEQDKVKVKDKEETKQEESPVRFLKSIEEVVSLYQENILLGATVSEDMEHEIKTACGRYSPDWVYDAIREALAMNEPHWRYIVGILKNWSKYGKKSG